VRMQLLGRLSRGRRRREVEAELAELYDGRPASQTHVEQLGSTQEQARGFVISLSARALFPPGGWNVLPSAHVILDRVAEVLAVREGDVLIEGHSDSAGADLARSIARRHLSFRRALSVRDYLIERGVRAERIGAIGMGDRRPVAGNETPEGRAANQRIEIVVKQPPRPRSGFVPDAGPSPEMA
jgi:outer membrane protein OmpA-like peptidoglycan-associated protein